MKGYTRDEIKSFIAYTRATYKTKPRNNSNGIIIVRYRTIQDAINSMINAFHIDVSYMTADVLTEYERMP